MVLYADDILPDEPNAEVVHWMAPGPMRFGSREVPMTAIAAFALGVGVAVGAFYLFRYLEPRREALPPWRWRRGSIH